MKTKSKPKPKQQSGGRRLLAANRKPVLLGLTPEQHDTLRRAAAADGRPMTVFAIRAAMQAAESFLKNLVESGS